MRTNDEPHRSANPADAHFVGQASLFNELGVQIMQDAFTRGAWDGSMCDCPRVCIAFLIERFTNLVG